MPHVLVTCRSTVKIPIHANDLKSVFYKLFFNCFFLVAFFRVKLVGSFLSAILTLREYGKSEITFPGFFVIVIRPTAIYSIILENV